MSFPFNPGIGVAQRPDPLTLNFAEGVRHPAAEVRRLADVRRSLADPSADGPEDLYAIYMDVADVADMARLVEQDLLFGIVRYAGGTVGDEPVRSQGHVHAISVSCGSSTPELYEFWEGRGAVYMQERVADQPGRCFAVHAEPGDKVLVPPGWAHFTVNAGVTSSMTFAAWCVRDYAFDYSGIRERQGLAWYPKYRNGAISWEPNPHYDTVSIEVKAPRLYTEFGITDQPIYPQWQSDNARMAFVAKPALAGSRWDEFVP